MTTPAIPTQETSGWLNIMKAIRRSLLAYTLQNNEYLSDILGTEPDTRLFLVRAPDDAKFPYGTLRLEATNDGMYHGMRLSAQCEIMLYGRPWTQQAQVEAAADLIEQGMHQFILNSDGLAFCHGKQRQSLPPGPDPADSEVCSVRLVFELAIWPAYLTRLTTVLPE
jgi:hypothetical protein